MPATPRRKKPDIAIIGAGTLASALARALQQCGHGVSEIVSRDNADSLRCASALARRVKASAATLKQAKFSAEILWICVPDDAIAEVAQKLASRNWSAKVIVHSSGALGSDILNVLKQRGAEIGSAHPLMTFVNASMPDFTNVPFALEGDPKAITLLGAIARTLGGKPFRIRADFKPAYHAFGFFSSPAIASLIAAAQAVGKLAGLDAKRARELMEPIVRQTIDNCFATSPQEAFSGPLRRGDVETIRKHMRALEAEPELLEFYRALARVALRHLPVAKANEVREVLG
ncbi:MAG TPA: Rossmann-like and DUF2520 domain-containing protein [Terriglobales bacterium]|nr:Rossmann-like and DUF2520 domain-containing protein [Terriglobales bacterium]